MSQYIQFEIDSGVARITLNNPDKLNSFNRDMARELQNTLDECKTNHEIRAVLLTGAGRAFCAGQDLAEVIPAEHEPAKDLGQTVNFTYNPIIIKIRELEKPVICAVNGVAAGAGANIAMACDIAVAGQSASFIQSFRNIGLIPDSGGTFFLPRVVGLQRATAMMFLGEKIKADLAYQFGMVWRVIEDDKLQDEALALAKELASLPTRGFGLTKRGLNKAFFNDLYQQLTLEEQLQKEAGYTHDYTEGVKAFLEKRKPDFKGE